jgi:hypothetical protein
VSCFKKILEIEIHLHECGQDSDRLRKHSRRQFFEEKYHCPYLALRGPAMQKEPCIATGARRAHRQKLEG